jgi:RND superfamily putative drug exporter
VAFQAKGLAFTIPIIVYLFVTAVGTDYNILITARLREEIRDGREPRRAAGLAVERAGPSVAAAAVILAGTFGVLLISGVPLFVEIGFAVTTGILLTGFVVSLLLVPAATALLGRAAWWPGTAVKAGPGPAAGVQHVPAAAKSATLAEPTNAAGSTAMSRPDGISSPGEARRRP